MIDTPWLAAGKFINIDILLIEIIGRGDPPSDDFLRKMKLTNDIYVNLHGWEKIYLLVGARGFECAGGAQASLEGCFIRLWQTPTLIPMCQATYVLARTLKIFLLSWLFCNQETLQYGAQKNPSATDRFLSFLNHVL